MKKRLIIKLVISIVFIVVICLLNQYTKKQEKFRNTYMPAHTGDVFFHISLIRRYDKTGEMIPFSKLKAEYLRYPMTWHRKGFYVNELSENIPLGEDGFQKKFLEGWLIPSNRGGAQSRTFIIGKGERYLADTEASLFNLNALDILNHNGPAIQICLLGIKERFLLKDYYFPLKLTDKEFCHLVKEKSQFTFNEDSLIATDSVDVIRLVIVASNEQSKFTIWARQIR